MVSPALLAGLVACGGSVMDVRPDPEDEGGTGVPDLHAQLTGSFTGSFRSELFQSEDQVIALAGVLTLELSESDDGGVAGAFALEGILSDDQFSVPIAGYGPVVGTVSPHPQTATLGFTATPQSCPGRAVEFSGAFDRRVAQLQIEGPILILDLSCMVVLTFPTSVWLGSDDTGGDPRPLPRAATSTARAAF